MNGQNRCIAAYWAAVAAMLLVLCVGILTEGCLRPSLKVVLPDDQESQTTTKRAAACSPTYKVKEILQSPGCTSVDMSPDRTTLYARVAYGDWDEGYRVFDVATGKKLWDYRPGSHVNSAPWRALVSADNNYIYMTTYYGGAVRKIQIVPSTGAQVASISVGSWPFGMAFDSQRRFLYVEQGCSGTVVQGSLKVIDTATNSVVGTVSLNGEPSGAIVAPGDNFVYVESRTSSNHTFYKIRMSDLQVTGTFSMPATRMDDTRFSLSPDGGIAYLPDPAGNSVHVVNTSIMAQTDLWALAGVRGFFVSPDGNHALVTPWDSPTVRVFNLSSKAVVQTLNVGTTNFAGKWAPYWDWDGVHKYVYLPVGDGVAVLVP